ncbi:MAG: hypothetical protein KKB81_05500 [Candidatus Margulisbacteria bacterium]|nr:hypothetical protein [Candidatus Margulisiibacteriota bacterium]MBU1021284.1 hypothetical protein [Candidatus Margulisiibacteriota bacterium]MBU1729227.1 hypothetical protein [Candidatus Margulisiibacteriota bacterium]MBU1768019.1 hypothetical protein [Candidatus Omnitrophota bacterium]MBU1954900.1 hypothetical protein [Candidatus Margulisiibacteriota bacterium]
MKIKLFLIFIIVLLGTVSSYAETYTADPSRIGIGAKPLSLGKAVTALPDDASAIFANPAGLPDGDKIRFTSMSGKLIDEYDYVTVGVSHPLGPGTIGIGYVNLGTGDIPITSVTGSGTTATISVLDSTDYYSTALIVSYAMVLDHFPFLPMMKNPSVGANFKLLFQGFSNTSSLEGAAGTGMDMDIGSQWSPASWLNCGINFKNIFPASLGGRFIWQRNNVTEEIPMTINIGTNFILLGDEGLYSVGGQELSFLVDSEMSWREVRPGIWHLGTEWKPVSILAIRGGIDQSVSADDNGAPTVDNNLCAGVGLNYRGFSFDYAYHRFGDLDITTSHFFSLGLEI